MGASKNCFSSRERSIFDSGRFAQTQAGKVSPPPLSPIYDIAHNMAKVETHEVNGRMVKLCVHRKGATRAFGPGSPELPAVYRDIGQPVLVPGSMGTKVTLRRRG